MTDRQAILNTKFQLSIWESTISSPKFGTTIVSTAYGAYLHHAYAQNLAKPPFMRICREFENLRDLHLIWSVFVTKILLSGKFSLFVTLLAKLMRYVLNDHEWI